MAEAPAHVGRWVDEQCDVWWGDRRCLGDLEHIDHEQGGHHTFDLRDLGVAVPVLVKPSAVGLRQIKEASDGHA